MKDITLSIRQHDRTWALGTADAGTAKDNRLGQVTWTVELPDELKTGIATLLADQSAPLKVVVAR